MNTSDEIGSLQMQIAAVEGRLRERRSCLATHLRGTAATLRARMTAPGTLWVAFGIGVVVEQGTRDRTWSLVPLLSGLGLIRRAVLTLTSLANSLDAAAS